MLLYFPISHLCNLAWLELEVNFSFWPAFCFNTASITAFGLGRFGDGHLRLLAPTKPHLLDNIDVAVVFDSDGLSRRTYLEFHLVLVHPSKSLDQTWQIRYDERKPNLQSESWLGRQPVHITPLEDCTRTISLRQTFDTSSHLSSSAASASSLSSLSPSSSELSSSPSSLLTRGNQKMT